MSSDRITQAITNLRAALKILQKNNHTDPLMSLRAAIVAHAHAQDATRLIREETHALKGAINDALSNLQKRSTDYDPATTPTD